MTNLIDGVTPLPENGGTGWGTTLNTAISSIDSRFTYSAPDYGLAANVLSSSLTSVGTLSTLAVSGNASVGGNLTITGNVTINGTTTTINSNTVTTDDIVVTLGGDTAPAADDNKDRGVEFRWHDGTAARIGFFGYDDSTGKFTFIPNATNTVNVFSGTLGTIDVGAVHINGSQIAASDLSNGTTGSGSVVLATSPTLTTPAIGAATATSLAATGAAGVVVRAAATQDGVALVGRAGGTSSYEVTITPTTLAADRTLTLPDASGTVALTVNHLGVFGSTTSAQLAGIMSDETGSGALVFATSPSLTTPNIGVATATSVNKVAITAPATSATLTIADGKTLTASNTLTFTGTDASSVAFGTGGTVAYVASPTFTGQVTVPAGTTSAAPIIFQSGALLTAAAGGRMEYDGNVFYLTPSSTAVGGRGVAETSHYFALSGARTLSDVNTAQSVFGVSLTVQGSTTYEFEMMFSVSTTGTTSNSLGIGFGGTATLTSIAYQVNAAQNATSAATLTAPNNAFVAAATNTTITSAVATATFRNVWVRGVVRIDVSGTFTPQLTYSAAPGAAPSVAANSFIKMTPVGSNTVTTVGAWA